MTEEPQITNVRPQISRIRIRVQEIGVGNKALKSLSYNLYGTTAEVEYNRITQMYKEQLGLESPKEEPKKEEPKKKEE